MLTYDLDQRGSTPLYEYLYQCIRQDIITGVLHAGERLPSKRTLAQHLSIGIITVANAYAQLAVEGYITSKEKLGFFVEDVSNYRLRRRSAAPAIPEPREKEYLADFKANRISLKNFPLATWSRLMRETLSLQNDELLKTVPYNGVYELRKAIADYLAHNRAMQVDPAQIIIGAGTQSLYNLIVQLLGRSHVYALENPGYPQLAAIYKTNDVFCRYLPMDEQGIRADVLENSGADILHISPSHQFPTGIVMPVSRRYELLRWAKEKSSRYIIEDDYDCEFRLYGRPIPPLQSIDSAEKVIYINTFSKTLAPTFRISYMVLPVHLASLFYEKLGFYSCTVSNFEQFTLAKFIEDGYFERHINRMRTYYRTKRDRLLHYLATCKAAPALTVEGENSGLHFLLHLATQASDTTLTQAALAQGIQIKFLSDYYHDKTSDCSHTLLMNYTGLPDDELYPALDKLFAALEPYLEL